MLDQTEGWEIQEASIHTTYKKKSPNQKMNYSLLLAVRHLRDAEHILNECCAMKEREGMSNRYHFWNVSKEKHNQAGTLLKRCSIHLRNLEA